MLYQVHPTMSGIKKTTYTVKPVLGQRKYDQIKQVTVILKSVMIHVLLLPEDNYLENMAVVAVVCMSRFTIN
jgi:hypothetical protein